MGQEWDYPQSRSWRREMFIRPASRRWRDQPLTIEHDAPKRRTITRWYIRQMRGREPWSYKAAITLLFVAFWLCFAAVIAFATLVVCMLIWPPAR